MNWDVYRPSRPVIYASKNPGRTHESFGFSAFLKKTQSILVQANLVELPVITT